MELNDVIALQGRRLVAEDFIKKFVPPSSCDNGISLYDNGLSAHWENYTFFNRRYIVYESLTKMQQERLGNIDDILNASVIQFPTKTETDKYNPEIALLLEFSYSQVRLAEQYTAFYRDRFLTTHEITVYSHMHCLVAAMFGLESEGYRLKEIYHTFQAIKSKFKLYNFKVNSYRYFCRKLDELEKDGIENGIIHKNKFSEKSTTIVPKYVLKQITRFYCQSTPVLLYYEIVDHVNHEIEKRGYMKIKIWVVKKICKEPEFQNLYKPFRLGRKWAEQNLDSWLLRSDPRFCHDLWEVDGTVVPFYVLDGDVVTRLWVSMIVDVKSRCIISWAIGRYESAELIYEVYRLAVVRSGCLARQIVRDNAKAYESRLITGLETQFEEMHCLVRAARPGNSQDKGTVEKVHDILHTRYYKNHPGFIGDSWKSDREQYRLEPVILRELRKKENAKLPREVVEIVDSSVNAYNKTVF